MRDAVTIEFLINDDMMIEAWHSSKPMWMLREDFKTSEHTFYHAWNRLKLEGRLPTRNRKVNGEWSKGRVVKERPSGVNGNSDEYHDRCRRNERVAACNELLALLREHHGEAGRPDIYPGSR